MAPEGHVLQVSPCTSQLTQSLPCFPLREGVYSMENSILAESWWHLARFGMVYMRVGAESHEVWGSFAAPRQGWGRVGELLLSPRRDGADWQRPLVPVDFLWAHLTCNLEEENTVWHTFLKGCQPQIYPFHSLPERER